MQTTIILTQIFTLAVIILVGVIATLAKILTNEGKDMLSKLIFNVSLPLMLFTNFLKLEATPRLLTNSAAVLSIAGFVILFMLLSGWTASRIFKIKGREAAVFRTHSMFGNTIFLGFPLITALFGEEGLLYASMYQFISTIFQWTIGVITITQGNGASWKSSIKRVINPNSIATLAGLIFFIFSIRLPAIVVKPLSELGAANTWLSMLYIGAMLVLADVRGLLGRMSPYILSVNRLIIVPLILIAIFASVAALTGFSPDKMVTTVIILEASMPCMASVVIMARELGADDHQAVGNVFVSTILSVLTLPLVLMIINKFL
jgi:malate permease and related proteins